VSAAAAFGSFPEEDPIMTGRIDARLAELGITLPTAMPPMANYVPAVRAGSLVVVSGQVPAQDGRIVVTGKVGDAVTVQQGQDAARLCLMNVLTHLRTACGGDLDRVVRVVRLGGFVAASPGFTQHALVMNGASDLAVELFGEAGRHARSTIGVSALPGDAAVEVEGMFEVAL
jgi:enamine deaminase RidA (YjgF/YER057c/UK114 family)